MNDKTSRCGYVALVGKPNVGKSTLMNKILGAKVSITSRKPQTTRQRVIGIKTIDDTQVVYVDIPGLQTKVKSELNRYMNRVAKAAMTDVNVIVYMVDAGVFDEQDQWVMKLLTSAAMPVILAVNKIDKLKDKSRLLPYIQSITEQFTFKDVVPISAKNGDQVLELEHKIIGYLPKEQHYFPPEQLTDRSDRFVAAEFVREKLMRYLGQEVPYGLTVTIDAFEHTEKIIKIAAIIWVEKTSHKSIVIGKGGAKLKVVGTEARRDLERYFDNKILLKLWVKVKSGWSDDSQALQRFGYEE